MRYALCLTLLMLMITGCSKSPREAAHAGQQARKEAAHAAQADPQWTDRDIEEPPKDGPPPDNTAIPQDMAKTAERERKRMEWHLRTSVGAYDKIGKKDARWDDLARKAVDLAVRQSFEPDSKITGAEVNRAAKAAVDVGCDDPLVGNIYTRSSNVPTTLGTENLIRRWRDTTKAYAASPYPAFRRAGSLETFARWLMDVRPPDDAARKEIEATLDASLALLPVGAKSDERNAFWVDKWHDTVISIIKDYRGLGVAPEAAYERADAKMANIPELEEIRLMVRGTFWFFYGWEARTLAFAPAVPAGGFRSLEERLAVAKEAFEEAWKLRPENAYAAAHLMDIDKSIGGDRATMELWFERAMKANGDARDACWTKLDWLDPKWHGTSEEMLAFGRQCRDTKNWRSGITLLCADAHWRIAGKPGNDQNKYLALPEVWADIKSVYDEYLKHYPEDNIARSKFATFCYLSLHFREAEVQYVALGDHLQQWSEFPFVPLSQLRQNRQRNARVVLNKEGRITFPGWHFVGGKNDDGEWQINVPVGAPHQEKPGILGADASHVWNCSAGGITYGIRVLYLPPALRNDSPERVLGALRSVIAKERGAQPRNLRDTLLAARPAQEFDFDVPGPKPMQLRVKTIVIGTWLFELSVTASKSDITSAAAREFFDSFAFQPKANPSSDVTER
jgi:hypothetical protein